MPKKDEALKAQRKQLDQQIEALENEIENAPDDADTSAQEEQIRTLRTQRDQVHDQWLGSGGQRGGGGGQGGGQGRATAPGQTKRTQDPQ